MTEGADLERFAAYHEAGHAVAAVVLKLPLERVSIVPSNDSLGECSLEATPKCVQDGARSPTGSPEYNKMWQYTENRTVFSFAGPIAEGRAKGRAKGKDITLAALSKTSDWECEVCSEDFESLAFVRDKAQSELEELLGDKAYNLVYDSNNWAGVEAVAEALLEEKELSGSKVRKLVQEATRRCLSN